MMTRYSGILLALLFPLFSLAQGGTQQLRTQADGLFNEERYADALPLYAQLVSLSPGDRVLNYLFGTCLLFGGEDKEKAIGHLKFATEDPGIPAPAWYWLGRAYHLNYRFADAQAAYQRFRGTGDKKALERFPVRAKEQQCRNGQKLLSNLKEITVRGKVEVDAAEFFRYYDLSDIGGRIVVVPEEIRTTLDKRRKHRSLLHIPEKGGPIYFSSHGKDGKTGLDIYRTELMPDGRFAVPVKLAGFINTDEDEDYPYMHPDGRSFYFSSKGHNSMGGYDVFKATYDLGMSAFGRPENLDFAVNTPDDDIFYVVDAEHKEACFASGRSSRQGQMHVYRVATTRLPLVITVLQGTFASEIDPNDRKARIVVEDALTREQVADVRTDINGSYVLSLPRTGKFRFLVDCGPSGKTHIGMVDVPRSEQPRAYRQELSLVRSGDLEQLVIRNYFETPLEGDLIALALDEIKRRARLDVSDREIPLIADVPAPSTGRDDPLTKAGFSGDVTEASVVAMAREHAAKLEQQAAEFELLAQEAFRMAMENAEASEEIAQEAERTVARAREMSDEVQRNSTMTEAARLRQRSREANQRAKAAHRAGTDLSTESMATRQKATLAAQRATDVERSLAAKKEDDAVVHLTELKKSLDARSAPGAEEGMAERTRRSVTEGEKEASRAMEVARNMRMEESELTDRRARLDRERTTTKNAGRRSQLDREIAEMDDQLGHLRKETEAAFNKAAQKDRETAVSRGESSLVKYLTDMGPSGTAQPVEKAELESLAQRIEVVDERIDGMSIDARYDALIALSAAEQEARTFDWALARTGRSEVAERSTTRAADRQRGDEATAAQVRAAEVPGTADERRVREGAAGQEGDDPFAADGAVATTEGAADVPGSKAGGRPGEPNDAANDIVSMERAGLPAGNDGGAGDAATTGTDQGSDARTGDGQRSTDGDDLADRTDSRSRDGEGGTATGTRTSTADAAPAGSPAEQSRESADARAADRPGAVADRVATRDGAGESGAAGMASDGAPSTTRDARAANATSADAGSATGTTAAIPPSTRDVSAGAEERTADAGTTGAAGSEGLGVDEQQDLARTADGTTATTGILPERAVDALDRRTAADGDGAFAQGMDTTRKAKGAGAGQRPPLEISAERFLIENEIAELEQLVATERNRSKREEIQRQVEQLHDRLASLPADPVQEEEGTFNAQDVLGSAGDGPVDMTRIPLVFDREVESEELIAQLYQDYERNKGSLEQVADADERAAGLQGLELMLADSVQAEMRRQVAILELDPVQAERVLPRVDRLRRLKEEHEALAEQHLQVRSRELAGLSPVTTPITPDLAGGDGDADIEERAPTRTMSTEVMERSRSMHHEPDPVLDRFVAFAPLREEVYSSGVDHRSPKVADAVALKDKDLYRMHDLTLRIDSMEYELAGMDRNKESERLQRNIIKLRDERIITRTELGQRTAFLSREEWRTANDSIKGLERSLGSRGLAPSEPLLLLAKDMRVDANERFEEATKFRKRADRTEDIVLRDSLYRAAYAKELEALREIDRSITVHNYLLGGAHQRGESLAYREVAAKVYGIATDIAMDAPIAQSPAERAPVPSREGDAIGTAVEEGDAMTRSAPMEETVADTPVQRDGLVAVALDVAGGGADAAPAARMEDPVADSPVQRDVEAPATTEAAGGSADALPPARTEEPVAKTPEERDVAAPIAMDTGARTTDPTPSSIAEVDIPMEARRSARLYERYLDNQGTYLQVRPEEVGSDPRLFGDRAQRAEQEARILDRRSDELTEEAFGLEAQAVDARKRDRERLEKLAVRYRKEADSLHMASIAKADEALDARLMEREAEALNEFRQRLVKFYYLSAEEQDLVMVNEDRSRYFQARTRAMEQYDAATEAELGARSSREVAAVLRTQASTAAAGQAEVLERRAIELLSSADSLENVASRLRGAANVNEAQATVMMQALTEEDSNMMMAMENRARRTEPLLSEARDQAGPVRTAATTAGDEDDVDTARSRELPSESVDRMPFRIPEVLASDVFQLRSTEQRTPEPIPVDMPMPSGIVFKVQVGAFRNAVPEGTFSDMTPVMAERLDNGLMRYTAGLFTGMDQANEAKEKVRGRGYRDAFVVAYRDGQRITLAEAMRETREGELALERTVRDVPAPATGQAVPQPASPSDRPAAADGATRPAPASGTQRPATTPAPAPGTGSTQVPATAGSDRQASTTGAPATVPPAATIARPVPPAMAIGEEDIEEILAAYPASAGEIISTFTPQPASASYYNVPGAAPARQVELVQGLFFTVQVGVYSRPVPLDKLFNIVPLNSERTETDKIRYTTGVYLDMELARERKDEAVSLGVKDAFITAYLNGKRIPVREARALMEKFGPEIMAKP